MPLAQALLTDGWRGGGGGDSWVWGGVRGRDGMGRSPAGCWGTGVWLGLSGLVAMVMLWPQEWRVTRCFKTFWEVRWRG